MLEAGVEMRLETEVDDDGVVVAINVGVHAVEALENLEDQWAERSWKADTDTGGEHGFIVDVGLYPGHEVFNVLRGGHLCGLLELVVVLPKVFKSRKSVLATGERGWRGRTHLLPSSQDSSEGSKIL